MIRIEDYIQDFQTLFIHESSLQPWEITDNLDAIISKRLNDLGADYKIENKKHGFYYNFITYGIFIKIQKRKKS